MEDGMSASGPSEPTYNVNTENQNRVVGVQLLKNIEDLHRAGKNSDVLTLTAVIPPLADADLSLRIRVVAAMAAFDLGDVIGSIAQLRSVSTDEDGVSLRVRFGAAFAHFLRESDFLQPSALLPLVAKLRQLA